MEESLDELLVLSVADALLLAATRPAEAVALPLSLVLTELSVVELSDASVVVVELFELSEVEEL